MTASRYATSSTSSFGEGGWCRRARIRHADGGGGARRRVSVDDDEAVALAKNVEATVRLEVAKALGAGPGAVQRDEHGGHDRAGRRLGTKAR